LRSHEASENCEQRSRVSGLLRVLMQLSCRAYSEVENVSNQLKVNGRKSREEEDDSFIISNLDTSLNSTRYG